MESSQPYLPKRSLYELLRELAKPRYHHAANQPARPGSLGACLAPLGCWVPTGTRFRFNHVKQGARVTA